MSLAKRVTTPPPARAHGFPCSIGKLLDSLEGDELKALRTMLGTPENHGWPQNAIYDALTEEGYEVGRQTINRHRAGRCICDRDPS